MKNTTNMMQVYLGDDYSDNHLKNFNRYWLKANSTRPAWDGSPESRAATDEWRKSNDIDCLYYNGDLRADTLMSAFTPIKWVAGFINKGKGIKFVKTEETFKLFIERGDELLPSTHELVRLLNRFLELAELPCNYILLPDRHMNNLRYNLEVNGKVKRLFDEVPATLWHVFEKDTLGKFFPDEEAAAEWIRRENLQMGFRDGVVKQSNVIPLIDGLAPGEVLYPVTEAQIRDTLIYMIRFLEARGTVTDAVAGFYMCPRSNAKAIGDDGALTDIYDEAQWALYRDGSIRRLAPSDGWLHSDLIIETDYLHDDYILRYSDIENMIDDLARRGVKPLNALLNVAEDLRGERQDGVAFKYQSEWSKPRGDLEFYHGNAYDLSSVFELAFGWRAYLFEGFGSFRSGSVDLGLGRILKVGFYLRLILIHGDMIDVYPIQPCFPDGDGVINLAGALKELGICHRIIGGMTTRSLQVSGVPGWVENLNKTRAVFSAKGFALERMAWREGLEFDFEMHFVGGVGGVGGSLLRVDGASVKRVTVGRIPMSLLDEADGLVYKLLTSEVDVSCSELMFDLRRAGLSEIAGKIRFYLEADDLSRGLTEDVPICKEDVEWRLMLASGFDIFEEFKDVLAGSQGSEGLDP